MTERHLIALAAFAISACGSAPADPPPAATQQATHEAPNASTPPTPEPTPAIDPDTHPLLRALIEDRVGADYFELTDDVAEQGEPAYIRSVTRHCEDAARAAVRALGDDWLCGEAGCGPSDGCEGNGCERVSFEDGAVLAHWRGVQDDGNGPAADTLSAEQAARLRDQLACGATLRLEASFFDAAASR